MAIYHLSVKTGTRAGGQSAGAKSDYINRAGRYDRDDLLFAASGNMPVWAAVPGAYWQAADVYERVNGRLYKEIEGALPRELTIEQQRELVEAFVHAIVDLDRLPYSLAIHAGEGKNPHCHLMISERMNDGIPRSAGQWFKRYNGKNPAKGGARKTESLKPQAWLEQTRKLWADLANDALERAGHHERIDHRTLEAQGIDRVPQIHLGPNVRAMKDKGIQTDRGDRYQAIAGVNAKIAVLEAERVRVDQEWLWWADQEAKAAEAEAEDAMWVALTTAERAESERRQAESDAEFADAIWVGVPVGKGIPRDDVLAGMQQIERYGVAMWVVPGSVMVEPDQQGRSPKQIAAALYRQTKEQAQREGWAAIEFFGVSLEARAEIERMATEDGWSDRIQFREDAAVAGPGYDLDAAMQDDSTRPERSPVSGPEPRGPR